MKKVICKQGKGCTKGTTCPHTGDVHYVKLDGKGNALCSCWRSK